MNKLLYLAFCATISLQAVKPDSNAKQPQQDLQVALATAIPAQQNQGQEELPLSKRLAQARNWHEQGMVPEFAKKKDPWVIHVIFKSLLEGKDHLVDIPLDNKELTSLIIDSFHLVLNRQKRRVIIDKCIKRGADLNMAVSGPLAPGSRWIVPHLPLYTAVKNKDLPVVKLLLENGANPNKRPYDCCFPDTPLAGAVKSGNIAMVKLLLENGANPNLTRRGLTPPLKKAKNKEMRKLLKEHGAETNCCTIL